MDAVPNAVPKKRQQYFKVNDYVYFTAFMKEATDVVYVCQGKVTKIPDPNSLYVYRVLVVAVADRSLTGKVSLSADQKKLLGRALNKRPQELHKELGPIMMPKHWIVHYENQRAR